MYNGTHLLTKKINLKTSAHFRYFDVANNYQQEIYRVGINYTFNKKIHRLQFGILVNTNHLKKIS